ncbi:MAG: GldG family protein [Leptospiraceae bacterium]|nr:GldG family protein [Leptospiraceae bacterium]
MYNYWSKFKKSESATTILLILAFLSTSWLSYGFYFRADLSEEGTLRLTDSTKKTLRNLPQPVNIEAFFSSDVPDAAVVQVKTMRDFLTEYAASSNGRARLKFLDPDSDQDAKTRATELGISPAPIGSLNQRKQEIAKVYFSVALSYGDKIDTIPNILESRILEYELTSKIYKMAYPNERTIAFLAGHGQFTLAESDNPFYSLNLLKENLETLYGSIKSIDTNSDDIPNDVSTLLVVQPENLSEIDRFRLDQFLMRGGNLIYTASGMALNMQNGMATAAATDSADFLKEYGIELGSDMVLDPENYLPLPRRMGFQIVEIPYPVWVVSPRQTLMSDHTLMQGIPLLFFPYTSPLRTDAGKLPTGKDSGFEVDFLARSSGRSYTQSNFVMIDPMRLKDVIDNPNVEKQNTGSHNLIVHVRGKFKSQYIDKPLPPNAPKEFIKEASNAGRLLVVSTPYAFSDLGAQRSQGLNLNFLLSAIDTMNGMEDLVALRKKQKSSPQVKNMGYGLMQMLTFLNFFLPVAGIGSIGLMRYLRRRKLILQNNG